MAARDLLKSKDFVLLDGAMGTMLQKSGLKLGERPEILNITHPENITRIHEEYINSGTQIIYTNTFGANRHKLEGLEYSVDEVIKAGVSAARRAIYNLGKENLAFVALDIGPIGELLEPNGVLSFEDAYDIFKEQVISGVESGADIIVIETMTDLYEVKAAILAAKENSNLPVFSTMTFEKNARTFTGCSIESFVATAEGLGADAIGINCSLGPDEIYPLAKRMSKLASVPLIVKANAGLPNLETGQYDIDDVAYSEYVSKIASLGVKLVGGCCGTTPAYIKSLYDMTKSLGRIDLLGVDKFGTTAGCLCTPSKFIEIDHIKVVGERINPTGKKRFKKALEENDMDYILSQAIEQVDAGADVLDVNVGTPDIDEAEMMRNTIKALQSVMDIPLQIDSSHVDALEAGLRVYNGKAIVNSVNGDQESLDSILPLVKKYGAAVVGLTLDKNGIPNTAEERVDIARRIQREAEKYGISKDDIYIDCLTLTVSSEQSLAMETLKALSMVKKELGMKTILGVSNISFGLPNRDLINSTFLTMAMSAGLDLAIINPNIDEMMDAVATFKLLTNIDRDSVEFIDRFSDFSKKKKDNKEKSDKNIDMTIEDAILKGLKEETSRLTIELLKSENEMEIINKRLIPALDIVGERYEKGEIFLPQLIKSATASQGAFEVIKKSIVTEDKDSVSKGTIAMATVKGDIHDIGKNIVKVILENYGYKIIDLGRDVDIERIVDTVKDHKIKLLGLSALMTTTLVSMEDTIKRVKETSPECKIMVGGAVLTEDYAEKIGADYYCKDAKKSVECAKIIFG